MNLLSHVFLPIIIGGLIYVLFRSDSLLMFKWFEFLGLSNIVYIVRESVTNINLFDWVIYSLPDGLWVYSFATCLIILWNENKSYLFLFLIIPFLLGPGVEILQFFNLFKGTFDLMDLIITIIAFSLSLFKNIKFTQYENQVC
jgi:hypothetical protein